MRSFGDHHPSAVAVYFLAVAGMAMFCMDPVILALSLLGAVACCLVHGGVRGLHGHLVTLALFAVMALINPLISHNGVTVLFVLNHNPITLEALLYGVAAAAMIVAVLYWFRTFTAIMTSDKLLCLFGALSPGLALVLSMALRYVPLFSRQTRRVSQAQKALGLYRGDSVIDTLRGKLRVFSVMITWALENGITTADSMTARGYGLGRRSRFTVFRWRWGDAALLGVSILLAALTLWGTADRTVTYYPAMTLSPVTLRALTGYVAYGLLACWPLIIQAKEAIRWRCLTSNI